MIPAKPFAVAVMITISVIPTLFGDCPSGAAQCGLISTRPGCSPGVNYASNYVQSAEPILRANGDVDILRSCIRTVHGASPTLPLVRTLTARMLARATALPRMCVRIIGIVSAASTFLTCFGRRLQRK